MGQESSQPIDDSTPPNTLKDRTLEAVASYINHGAKRIVVMVGLDFPPFAVEFENPNSLTDDANALLIDWCWYKHSCWYSGFSLSRHRSIREPC